MLDLVIRIRKNPDGTAAVSCIRSDGSATWQRHRGAQAGFFPLHDLTHGTRCTAGELNEQLALSARALDRDGIVVTDAQLEPIRRERSRLFERWGPVPVGETLVLQFPFPRSAGGGRFPPAI